MWGPSEVNALKILPELTFERVTLNNGQSLHLVEAGPRGTASKLDEPTVVMVHGGAGQWRNWSRQIDSLARRYRILAPDLRGHGVSPWSGPCRLSDYQQDLQLLLDSRVRGPYVLLAHSFGGCLAADVAARADERLRGLAMLSTSGCIPRGLVYRLLELFSGHTDRFSSYSPYALACDSRVAQQLLCRILKEWNCWSLLPMLQQPTLAVAGQLDLLIPPSWVQRMARALPNCHYHVIRACGHVPMWEAPEQLGALLNDWLDWANFRPSQP